jgi:hypothetical protein
VPDGSLFGACRFASGSTNRQFLLVPSFAHLTIFDLASDQVVVSIEDATVINFGSWSPDSSQFVYVTPRVNSPQQQFYVSDLCQVHVPIPSPSRWANSNWYFYQLRQQDESGDIFWEHRLTSLSGEKDLLLDTTTGSLTHIIVLEQ